MWERMRSYSARALMLMLLAVAACSDSEDDPRPDAGTEQPDAGGTDSGTGETDAGADSGTPDAGEDAGTPDAGEDAGTPDAGSDAGGNLPPLEVPEGCNPLASEHDCLLPFPSDHFRQEDATLPSGHRVRLTEAARLKQTDGGSFDFTDLHPADGWSHGTQILALFPGGVDASNLPALTSPTAETTGTTVLLDAELGEGVLHFAELDPRAPSDARRALLLRPLVRLRNDARYIVALRGLVAEDGTPVPVPEGFRRIRDGQTAGDPLLAPIAARYEQEIFPVLQAAGIPRGELQLAWDFTTETQENVTRDMLDVRRLTMEVLAATPPAVTVTEVRDNVDEYVARRIRGTLRVPLFLENAQPGALLARDAQGRVRRNGDAEVPFTLQIPRSVWGQGVAPVRFMQYGHGFFGSQGEADGSFVRPFIQATRMVVLTVDWWGMSNVDAPGVLGAMANNPGQTMRFTDRVHQGMANQLAVTYAAKTTLRELAELRDNGVLVYDPEQTYYYGISQGHILGGTYVALSPHVSRAVFSVGGADFSLMMFRARPFAMFLNAIIQTVPDALDQQKFAALTQTGFDRIDPLTYAPHVLTDPYEGAPASRRLLVQYGLGDAQVPNVATELHARALGLTQQLPATWRVPLLPAQEGALEGSALVQFDFGLPAPLPGTVADLPAADNAVHEGVRRDNEGRDQVDRFLRPGGRVEVTCDGICRGGN
ncbi:hypothetical protein HPC49_21755 [Pyxidicoccus fallax]|uniref:PI-PLC Y-box domain-containing protein n=1 Tax=Pyxidicoccus fallax TaxID=394095 RepID=A0A848LQZ5_9BACT|nr:hypothetical protein [Pyxidicoccus fallax]NMO20121.1 hypothetical protein [Pyxidicoccus fallax]NPC80838.1 hypothetical protein [Pyxidicoccus fallax]